MEKGKEGMVERRTAEGEYGKGMRKDMIRGREVKIEGKKGEKDMKRKGKEKKKEGGR